MARPNFDSPLFLVDLYDPDTGDTRPSPLARGPIDTGDVIKWVAVWVDQNRAAAAGKSGYDQDIQNDWAVDTFLVKGSDDFSTEEPALAMALALIWRGGNEEQREFYWWMEAVKIAEQ